MSVLVDLGTCRQEEIVTLLSIQQIQRGLDDKFGPLEPMLKGFRLINGGVTEGALVHSESSLGLALPKAFRESIKRFDFGRLTIGPVAFCNTDDYLGEIGKLNTSVRWWGDGARPSNFLMVANSDPYAILLAIDTGAVWVMDPEQGHEKAICVAKDFDAYLRAIGTVMLRRNDVADKDVLVREVATAVGDMGFGYWEYLAR